jgi:predicted HAD superfamily phosphohydrolase YqeG
MEPVLPPTIIYVDVDDTLVRSFGSKRSPMTAMIERVRELHHRGAHLYCWSTGGAAYAREMASELGLEACFLAFLPKPHLLIDDVLLKDWRLTEVHPAVGASMEVEELLRRRP